MNRKGPKGPLLIPTGIMLSYVENYTQLRSIVGIMISCWDATHCWHARCRRAIPCSPSSAHIHVHIHMHIHMHTYIHTSMRCSWQPAEGCLRPATHFPLCHTGSDPRTDHPKPSIRAAAHAAMKWPAVGGQAPGNAIGPSGSIPMYVCYSAT